MTDGEEFDPSLYETDVKQFFSRKTSSLFVRDLVSVYSRYSFPAEETKPIFTLEDIDLKEIGKFNSYEEAEEEFLKRHPQFDKESVKHYIYD